MVTMRVAIIGAGAAGSSCAWRLLDGLRSRVAVSVFEMGRGAGGRAGTRRIPELPGLSVNHGAPLFHVPTGDEGLRPLIAALQASGYIREWQGTSGTVDVRTGEVGAGEASRGESEVAPEDLKRYVGSPCMSSVARGCLQLGREVLGDSFLEEHFGVRVKELKPRRDDGAGTMTWEVIDKDGKSYGEFDWLIVSGATPALERWRAGFKEEPPVLGAAKSFSSPVLRNTISQLDKPLDYEQVHVGLLAWDVAGSQEAESALATLQKLPFTVTQVKGDDILSKIVVQTLGPPFAVVALHSTVAFARTHKSVMGAGSFVSVTNDVEGTSQAEAQVSQQMLDAFQALLATSGASHLPKPIWGPALHRWGAAFPTPDLDSALASEPAWVLPDERFIFAGDFIAPPHACVYGALRSGIAAGDSLARIADGARISLPSAEQFSKL